MMDVPAFLSLGGCGFDLRAIARRARSRIFTSLGRDPSAAYGCLFGERGESGTWKVLKRAISGKLLAALVETSPTTVAGTSLLTSRLIAVV